VYYVRKQIALRKGRKEVPWLKTMLGRLPNLDCLEYAADYHEEAPVILRPEDIKSLSPLAQATLVGRNYVSGACYTMKQILAVLQAAQSTKAKLKKFKANHVPWKLFMQAPKQLQIMYEAAEHLVSLQAGLRGGYDASSRDRTCSRRQPCRLHW